MIAYIPFSFARSALFTPQIRRGEMIANEVVPSARYTAWTVDMTYSGPELTPAHAYIWQAVVAYGMKARFENINIKLTSLLKDIGRTSFDTKSKRWMLQLLNELSNANVNVKTPHVSFNGPLLAAISDSNRGEVTISFDSQLSEFLDNEVVKIDMSTKYGLSNHPLAAWLFDYTATLKETFNADINQMHMLSGSTLTPALFKIRLKDALDTVKEKGGIDDYEIKDSNIIIRKPRARVVFKTENTPKHIGSRARQLNAVQQANLQRIRVPL